MKYHTCHACEVTLQTKILSGDIENDDNTFLALDDVGLVRDNGKDGTT